MSAQAHADDVRLLVMGVSGCGKSTLAAQLVQDLGGTYLEGDDFHPPSNVDKMRRGIALDDTDRQPWLELLGKRLAASPGPTVLTCSALKQKYRDSLRRDVPGLRIVFIELELDEAARRLALRKGHYFAPQLVASQFQTLESPVGEANVLRVSALLPPNEQAAAVANWVKTTPLASEPHRAAKLSTSKTS
jgi:gluconokinase